jgi:hypothetical protein
MLPLVAVSLAVAFFIMVRMGVFERSKDSGAKERRSRGPQGRRLLDTPKPGKGDDERLEVFEDFIERLRGPEGDDKTKGKDA